MAAAPAAESAGMIRAIHRSRRVLVVRRIVRLSRVLTAQRREAIHPAHRARITPARVRLETTPAHPPSRPTAARAAMRIREPPARTDQAVHRPALILKILRCKIQRTRCRTVQRLAAQSGLVHPAPTDHHKLPREAERLT